MKRRVLLEVPHEVQSLAAFSAEASATPQAASERVLELAGIGGLGLQLDVDAFAPIPMATDTSSVHGAFSLGARPGDILAETVVVAVEMDDAQVSSAIAHGIAVWPSSELSLFSREPFGSSPADVLRARGSDIAAEFRTVGLDVDPYRPGVSIEVIQGLLEAKRLWSDGFKGQNVRVAIVDSGVCGERYPVLGGYRHSDWPRKAGTASVTSHGSMCAADVLVAAPDVRFYDYPFLEVPDSFGALKMFQAILEQRSHDGTPHIVSNSWGWTFVPTLAEQPRHEVWDVRHPLHRKIQEVVASGATVLFAAGNCGRESPSSKCHASSVGPGCSIHGANALEAVITVAAVNSVHERIGYSSQGPALEAEGFYRDKPDLAGYAHFFGNFGPGRPGGTEQPYDNGTSAACPLVAGVAALLLSAYPGATPHQLKAALMRGAAQTGTGTLGYDHETGYGVVNAGAAYHHLTEVSRADSSTPRGNQRGDVF